MKTVVEPVKTIKEFSDRLCQIKLRSDYILQVNTTKDVEYGTSEAAQVIKNMLDFADNKQFYILIVSGDYANVTYESIKLLSSPIAMSYSLAKAYVINSLPQKLMANFYLKTLKTNKPVKFFRNQTDAEQWLKSLQLPNA